MCLTCGRINCEQYEPLPNQITLEMLEAAAEGAGITVQEAAYNLMQSVRMMFLRNDFEQSVYPDPLPKAASAPPASRPVPPPVREPAPAQRETAGISR